MANKNEVAAFASDTLSSLKAMLVRYPDDAALKEDIARLEKKQGEAMGTMKVIGPCFSCKESETVAPKEYDYRFARWFMCPHKDMFCYDCIRKDVKVVLAKRKTDKEAKKKEEKKDDKKGKK